MNNNNINKEKKLTCVGGQGFYYSPETGIFEIIYTTNTGIDKTKVFTNLTEAKKYYDALKCEKAIWDKTKISELIEIHSFI